MKTDRPRRAMTIAAALCSLAGFLACAIGVAIDSNSFFRAWLCAYLYWLGLPLGGLTLVLVHDLTGGNWMGTARPVLNAAIATMPLATLAGIPAWVGLSALYSWTHPAPSLGNVFYLNPIAFYLRYAIDVVLWNLLAAFALWGPRSEALPIAPALSWLSALGLILLALSASFAAVDWILSLEPTFWSSVFPMTVGAAWFNTGLALVILVIAVAGRTAAIRDHITDLVTILFATTILWAYLEFVQFLIIWEENLKTEIPWYLLRMGGIWKEALFVAAGLGFFVPFFALLTAPGKRSRMVVRIVCGLILIGMVAQKWWLVLPQFSRTGPFWLDLAAILALGGLMLLVFFAALGAHGRLTAAWPRVAPGHG